MNPFQKFLDQTLLWIQGFAPKLLLCILTLVIGWWVAVLLSKAVKRGMQKANIDPGIISFLYSILKTTFRIIVVVCSVAQLGVNVTSIVAAIGAAGVTIGLALKDSLANIASGALIIINKPFHVGDYLETEGLQGTVTKIEMMFTTLTTYDNKTIVIPNARLTENNIVNYTAQKTRRLDLCYCVSYSDDLTKVKNILKKLVTSNEKILKNPEPVIAVADHKDNGIDIVVKVWCKVDDYWSIYYDMQEKVKLHFDENGIVIPFNQLDVIIKNT